MGFARICIAYAKFASMRKVLTASEMREVDRRTIETASIPSVLLMEMAANSVVREMLRRAEGSLAGRKIAVFCGKGNNGGDGLAISRLLFLLGADVRVFLIFPPAELSGDALTQYRIIRSISSHQSAAGGRLALVEGFGDPDIEAAFSSSDYIIDAIFGTGLTRQLSGRAAAVAEISNAVFGRKVRPFLVAVDVPSGLSTSIAEHAGKAFSADLTVSFTAPKPENVLPPFYRNNGELVIADIGSPAELIDQQPSKMYLSEVEDAALWLKSADFTDDSYKNRRGHLAIIAGSRDYSGAAVLAAAAAMRSGAGLVSLLVPEGVADAVAARLPEEIILRTLPATASGNFSAAATSNALELLSKANAVAIGCGLGREPETVDFVRNLLEKIDLPTLVDADGLNAISPMDGTLRASIRTKALVLTPHEGEFRRLAQISGEITDRVRATSEFAASNAVILVLKGERVLIGDPSGRVIVNPTGNSGLGKAGNGDTLTGLLGGFLAQAESLGIDLLGAVTSGVFVGGLSGDIAEAKFGKRVMTASDVREAFADAFQRISGLQIQQEW